MKSKPWRNYVQVVADGPGGRRRSPAPGNGLVSDAAMSQPTTKLCGPSSYFPFPCHNYATTVPYSSHHLGTVQPVPECPGPLDNTATGIIAIAFPVDAALMIRAIVHL